MISPTEEQLKAADDVCHNAHIQARDAFKAVVEEMRTENGVSLASMEHYRLANKEYNKCHRRYLLLTNQANKARWAKREKYD